MYDAKWKASFRRKMLKWFDENQRDLPWRKKRTPYRIWVSEIMLQQTQVVTVIDYYQRFMKRFPNVKKLAAADEAEVLKLWEGLGYYRRARQMHKAANVVVSEHGGKFPTDFDSVLALPGIGRYTAGAILSISLDQKQPILEGNTIRLFARLMEMKADPRNSSNQKAQWEFSESLLPRKRCGDFNQSLMELGSEVCHPKRPQCLICPVRPLCPTAIKGLQESIPVASKKVNYLKINEAAIIIKHGDKFLVRQCGKTERWAGLWDFPRFEIGKLVDEEGARSDAPSSESPSKNRLVRVESVAKIPAKIQQMTGLNVTIEQSDIQIKHAATRYRITLDCYIATSVKGRIGKKSQSQFRWASKEEIRDLAMNVSGRKVFAKIAE